MPDNLIEFGEIRWSENIAELMAALSAAQGEITAASKDKENPHFKSRYADLESCWAVARGPLCKHGLAVTQWAHTKGRHVTVTTILGHKSGQWMAGSLTLLAMKDDPQAAGSAITYARRYAFSSVVGITSDEDDDGNLATARGQQQPQQQQRPHRQQQQPQQQQQPEPRNVIDPETVYDGSDTLKRALCQIAMGAGLPKEQWSIVHERSVGQAMGAITGIAKSLKEELTGAAQ